MLSSSQGVRLEAKQSSTEDVIKMLLCIAFTGVPRATNEYFNTLPFQDALIDVNMRRITGPGARNTNICQV